MFQVGIDVGSTTIKCVVLDEAKQIVYKSYHRHRALIKEKVNELVQYIGTEILKGQPACLALTGSASLGVAEQFGIPFVQEVVATQIAVEQYPETIDVVIELGGEDAKILFFTGGTEVRMNGSCAGGTAVLKTVNSDGFLDEVTKKGAYIKEKLLSCPEVASVDGMGLMIGIQLKSKVAGDIVKGALDKGLLLLTAKTKVRLLPPLTISYEDIDKGLEILIGLLNG